MEERNIADENPSIQPEWHCRMRAKCNVPSNVLNICYVTGPLPLGSINLICFCLPKITLSHYLYYDLNVTAEGDVTRRN